MLRGKLLHLHDVRQPGAGLVIWVLHGVAMVLKVVFWAAWTMTALFMLVQLWRAGSAKSKKVKP